MCNILQIRPPDDPLNDGFVSTLTVEGWSIFPYFVNIIQHTR